MDLKNPSVLKIIIFVILIIVGFFGIGIKFSSSVNNIEGLAVILNILVSYIIADIIASIYSAIKG